MKIKPCFLLLLTQALAVFTFVNAQLDEPDFSLYPPFLGARSDDQRCQAIKKWVSSIVFETRQEVAKGRYDRGTASRSDEELFSERAFDYMLRDRFALTHFGPIFGKLFHQTSDKELKQISSSLDKCASDSHGKRKLMQLLFTPRSSRLSETSVSIAQNREAQQRRNAYLKNLPPEAQTQDPKYIWSWKDGAVMLLNTPEYRVYGTARDWCSYTAYIAIIFKAGEDYAIKGDSAYVERFYREILPLVQKTCKPESVTLMHHVAGYYISNLTVSGQPDPREGYVSDPVNTAFFHDLDPTTNRFRILKFESEIYSIADVRKEPERRAQRAKEYAEQEKIRLAERERKAAMLRKEKWEAKAPAQRAEYATLLKHLEKGGVKNINERYDFSKYSNSAELLNIYMGNFFPFTEDKEPGDAAAAILKLDLGKMQNFNVMRAPLIMAYPAYHLAYADKCGEDKALPWSVARIRVSGTVTRNGLGMVLGRTSGGVIEFDIREPFVEAFEGAWIGLNSGDGIGQLMAGITPSGYANYSADFAKFLETEKCNSPAVRQMEVNLHLAQQWAVPLQILYQPPLKAAAAIRSEPKSKSETRSKGTVPGAPPKSEPVPKAQAKEAEKKPPSEPSVVQRQRDKLRNMKPKPR